MKLVINSCYGGFGLSSKATKRYLELKGKEAYFYKQTYNRFIGNAEFIRIDDLDSLGNELFIYCTTEDQGEALNDYPESGFYHREIPRNDKHLVQVVEELGAEANSMCSKLEIVEIENGRWYKIDEYDGYESVEYRDIDDEWELAEDNKEYKLEDIIDGEDEI